MTTATSSGELTQSAAGPHTAYPMRRWVFEDAAGRHDIDLGDSNVQCGRLHQLTAPPELELGYGSDRGTERLRNLVAGLYAGQADAVAITHGAQEALYLLYSVLIEQGDQVITFRPGWQQSWTVPGQMSFRTDVLELGPQFDIDADAVARAVGPRLRLIVLNTPCNPTGRRIGERELQRIVDLVSGTGAYMLLDEEYSLDLATSVALRSDRVISVSSLSKIYGLPGLRVGWMYGPPDVVSECVERKHLTSISNSVLCEALACDALSRRQFYTDQYRRLTDTGLRILQEWVAGHPDRLQLVPPQGTPFAWLQLTTGEASLSFCRRVLDTGVLLMPAETLGGRAGVRLCFAREPQVLIEGLRRIDSVLATAHDPQTKVIHDDPRSTCGVKISV